MEVRKEIGVVRIEKIDDTVRKEEGRSGGYTVRVRCVLEDGSTVERNHWERRQRDAKAYLASLPEEVKGLSVTLLNGQPYMWSQAYDL